MKRYYIRYETMLNLRLKNDLHNCQILSLVSWKYMLHVRLTMVEINGRILKLFSYYIFNYTSFQLELASIGFSEAYISSFSFIFLSPLARSLPWRFHILV